MKMLASTACSRRLFVQVRAQYFQGTSRLLSSERRSDEIAENPAKKRFNNVLARPDFDLDEPLGSMGKATFRLVHDSMQKLSVRERPNSQVINTMENLLKRLEDEAAVNPNVKLTTTPYNRLLRAYAKSNDAASLAKTQNLIQRMKESYQLPSPDTFTYDAALYVCTFSPDVGAPAVAEALLKEMQSTASSDGTRVAPTTTSYHNVILAHAKQSAHVYGAAAAAEDWLMHLSDLSCQPGTGDLRPTTQAFNHVLQAWAVSIENNGADRALQILELMMSLGDASTNPDSVSFATVINAFARRDRPEEAELVLKRALDYYTDTQQSADLTECLNRTMGAWSKSSRPDAAQRARDLLEDAYTLALSNSTSASGQSHIKFAPSAASHFYYIMVLLKDEQDGLERADQHLRTMLHDWLLAPGTSRRLVIPPTIGTVHTVMKAWINSQCDGSIERATYLVQLAAQAATKNIARTKTADSSPVAGTFSMCIDAWIKSKHPLATEKVWQLLNLAEANDCTDAYSYQAAINISCRAGTEEATWKAVDLLKRFEQRADRAEVKWISSQAIGLYTAIITALGKLRNERAAAAALELFRSIPLSGPRAALPTSKTYSSLMVCFAKLRTPEASDVVFSLFLEMKELSSDPKSKVQLDAFVMKTIIISLAQEYNQEHANDVISFLLDQIRSGRKDLAPGEVLEGCWKLLQRSRLSTDRRQQLERELASIMP